MRTTRHPAARFLLALAAASSIFSTARAADPVFVFHAPSEPSSLDPAQLSSSDASYIFNNIYRGLYVYDPEDGLKPEGAKSCEWAKGGLALTCALQSDRRWSDGSPVTAEDYVRGFRRLVGKNAKSLGLELLVAIENATAVNAGEKPESALGVAAPAAGTLKFTFSRPDPDFLFKLTSSLLVPAKADRFPSKAETGRVVANGPYRPVDWQPGKRLRLAPNPHYKGGHEKRPEVEILFVDEDQTALNLYMQGRLSFLRRLPTTYIAKYKGRPDFHQVPVARFDYVGFGPELAALPDLRRALSLALDFRELQILYDALGIPGCPGIPEAFMDKTRCLRFDLNEAKKAFAKVPPEARAKRWVFAFSKLGGDDLKKGAEWMQAQWLKHLGLRVDLEQTEQGVFLQQLRLKPYPIFRKGVGLDRPTCLAALETFAPGGPENFLRLDLPAYGAALERLRQAKSEKERKRACGDGVQALLDQSLLVPLGRIHFTLLASPAFTGWRLNEMNQLDLARLRPAEGAKAK